MTIEEARILRNEAEKAVLEILNTLSESTGLPIKDITMSRNRDTDTIFSDISISLDFQ